MDKSFKDVIFSDEKIFRFHPGSRVGVWRRRGESRFKPKYLVKTTAKSEGIMVWGAIKCTGERVLKLMPAKVKTAEYTQVLSDCLHFIRAPRYT